MRVRNQLSSEMYYFIWGIGGANQAFEFYRFQTCDRAVAQRRVKPMTREESEKRCVAMVGKQMSLIDVEAAELDRQIAELEAQESVSKIEVTSMEAEAILEVLVEDKEKSEQAENA